MSEPALDTVLQTHRLSPKMRTLIISGIWRPRYTSRYRAWCWALYALAKERVQSSDAYALRLDRRNPRLPGQGLPVLTRLGPPGYRHVCASTR